MQTPNHLLVQSAVTTCNKSLVSPSKACRVEDENRKDLEATHACLAHNFGTIAPKCPNWQMLWWHYEPFHPWPSHLLSPLHQTHLSAHAQPCSETCRKSRNGCSFPVVVASWHWVYQGFQSKAIPNPRCSVSFDVSSLEWEPISMGYLCNSIFHFSDWVSCQTFSTHPASWPRGHWAWQIQAWWGKHAGCSRFRISESLYDFIIPGSKVFHHSW